MHSYLRAIGFSEIERSDLNSLFDLIIEESSNVKPQNTIVEM